LHRGRSFLGDDFDFLAQSPPDDRVIPVQSKALRFTSQDFIADLFLNQSIEFRRRRRSLPGAPEILREHPHASFVDDNILLCRKPLIPKCIHHKKQAAQ
jgi:hypothetical protein